MKMKVLIVDDEKPAREELKYLLSKYDFIKLCGEADTSRRALKKASEEQLDIAFLDIQIDDMNGFILAEGLLSINPDLHIVFATAYDQYAVKAFEMNAVDYILKPFSQGRLQKTLERIVAIKREGSACNRRVREFLGNSQAFYGKPSKIPVKLNNRVMLIDNEEIICVKTLDKENLIITKRGEFPTTHTLGDLEQRLDPYVFFRTHRGYIVNINHIKEIIPWFNNTYQLAMEGYEKEKVPVSRSNIKDFKQILGL